MVISYMQVLDVHTGATFQVAFYRTIGTFIGALTSFIVRLWRRPPNDGDFQFVIIAHNNAYALVVLAVAWSLPISYFIMFSSHPQLGTVM